MDNAYVQSTSDVLAHFRVAEQEGLSSQQVKQARETYGPNCKRARTFYHYLGEVC